MNAQLVVHTDARADLMAPKAHPIDELVAAARFAMWNPLGQLTPGAEKRLCKAIEAVDGRRHAPFNEKFDAARAMVTRGGGFAGCIADAWFRADPDNRARLEVAFADLFEKYAPAVTP